MNAATRTRLIDQARSRHRWETTPGRRCPSCSAPLAGMVAKIRKGKEIHHIPCLRCTNYASGCKFAEPYPHFAWYALDRINILFVRPKVVDNELFPWELIYARGSQYQATLAFYKTPEEAESGLLRYLSQLRDNQLYGRMRS